LALQAGSLALINEFEDVAPVGAILFMGAGIGIDLVGDALGHNDNTFTNFKGTLGCTLVGSTIGWAVGHGLENRSSSKIGGMLATAAVLSIGTLIGTLAYHWSNQPKSTASVRLMPTTLESPNGQGVQGVSMMGSF